MSWLQSVFNAREQLHLLGDLIQQLLGQFTEINGDDVLLERLSISCDQINNAYRSLESPTLDIATVGTTSAGKSTFVNALLGLKLAPMNADEMSAGLLEISHSSHWSIRSIPHIDNMEQFNNPEIIYDFLFKYMQEHIERRQSKRESSLEPHFVVQGPLLPMDDSHDFSANLGGQVGFRIFDLPGLRTVNDQENFRIIKNHIKRSFTIVVINMIQLFAREQREQLIEELRDTVRDLGNDTSTIIFIANQADRLTYEDLKNQSLQERCKAAEREIQQILDLSEDEGQILLLPFSALSYFRASQLWVSCNNDSYQSAQDLRRAFTQDFNIEYALDTDVGRQHDDELNQLFRAVQDDLRSRKNEINTDVKNLKRLALLGMATTGHAEFWDTLGNRVQDQGVKLLVYPIANGPIKSLIQTTRDLVQYARTRQIDSRGQLEQLLNDLEMLKIKSRHALEEHTVQTSDHLNKLLNILKQRSESHLSNTNDNYYETIAQLGIQKSLHPNLFGARSMSNKLISELEKNYLVPLRKFLRNKNSIKEVETYFSKHTSSKNAMNIALSYEKVKDNGYMEYAEKGLEFRYETDNQDDNVNKIKSINRSLAELYLNLRRAMTQHAERILEREANLIALDVTRWSSSQANKVWSITRDQINTSHAIGTHALTLPTRLECANRGAVITLQDDVIKIPDPTTEITSTEKKEVGKTREYPNKSCRKGKEIAIIQDFSYTSITIPSAGKVVEELSSGIKEAAGVFWDRFFSWLRGEVNFLEKNLIDEIREYSDTVERAVHKRINELESEAQTEQDLWHAIEEHASYIHKQAETLKPEFGFSS
jgi:GTPase SAR1 family protein